MSPPLPLFSHEETYGTIDPLLLRLCRAAGLALRAEDARLAATFASVPRELEAGYAVCNQGLAHSVFETALVYEIFKAWIPMVHTEWECGYRESPGKKADLVVETPGKATWLFEAKWWMSMSKKQLSFLDSDALKMLGWTQADQRFLLTFWYSPANGWDADLDAIKTYADRDHDGFTARNVYTAAFPTDVERTRGKGGSYFAFSAVAIGRR